MALNKHMHSRNIYKTPPDFGQLSKKYTEFSEIAKVDVAGKVTIDFKDPHSLRVLTKCLLKSDFNLNVDIPEDRLVPTLPLRLNYILWIEDLLASIEKNNNVQGLDIGTGACAIYPLLAAVKNKWHMIGTETDPESLEKAQNNVKNNNMEELIEIKLNTTSSVIENLFAEKKVRNLPLHFCMCNPPFYSSLQELYESRSVARHPPKNGFTGSPHELITEGGELEFCRKLINESKHYKDNILVFTTMVGHKYNLQQLVQDLKTEDIKHTHTEFCQGRVTRWGLAWTYNSYDIYKLVPPREKLRKKNSPMAYILPELPDCAYNLETAIIKIKNIFNKLCIDCKILEKRGNNISLDILAKSNTWSNQRRKRRFMKRIATNGGKKNKPNTEEEQHTIVVDDTSGENNQLDNIGKESPTCYDAGLDGDSCDVETTSIRTENGPLVHAFLKVLNKEKVILLEIEFLDGSGGKESLHQIVQFIKNNWK